MPTFCAQCAAPRDEDVCPIHGKPQAADGLDGPTVGGAAGRRGRDPEAVMAGATAKQGAVAGSARTTNGHRLPRPASGMTDPLRPLPKARKSSRGFWGPVLFLSFLGSLGVAAVWFNVRPKNMTLEQRLGQLVDLISDAAGVIKGETASTSREVVADPIPSGLPGYSGVPAPADPAAHPPEKAPEPSRHTPAPKLHPEAHAMAASLLQLAETTRHQLISCYQGAGQQAPAKLELAIHTSHGKVKVRHPEKIGHARNCVVSVIEQAAPPHATGVLHYKFE